VPLSAPLRNVRIHAKEEFGLLQEGVNTASGIHYDYVIFVRTEREVVHISEVVIPKVNPQEYSFYESCEQCR
jgi:hypothetical protein